MEPATAGASPLRSLHAIVLPSSSCPVPRQRCNGRPLSSLRNHSLTMDRRCLLGSQNVRCMSSHGSMSFYEDSEEQNFFKRIVHAWHVLFPAKPKPASNAEIAKQRLKMILISDRCGISDEAKQRIVENVVGALSSFVEIESEEKVQLNVSSDPDLGTVYSVIVPVRRVRPEYQDYSENLQNINYGDTLGQMKTLETRFEYLDDALE